MATAIQSFNKGINTDMSIPNLPEGSYRNAYNWTFTSNEAGGTGSLVNSLSNELLIGFPDIVSNLRGYVNVGEDIVFFFRSDDSQVSSIYFYESEGNTWTLLYEDLNTPDGSKLELGNYISGVGKLETPSISKVYWADGVNEVRFIDLTKDYMNPVATVDKFSLLPNVNLGSIYIDEDSVINGGNMKAGAVQYTYRMFNKYGAETVFGPTTQVVRLTSYSPGSTAEFYGSDIDKIINKSVQIEFSGLDTSFDYMRVYAIYYESLTDQPNLYLVQEIELNESSFSIIDTGDYPEQYAIDELDTVGTRLFTATDLAEKNNYLFAAGIKEIYFNEDIDCRAYRFKSASNSGILQSAEIFTSTSVVLPPNPDRTKLQSWEELYESISNVDGTIDDQGNIFLEGTGEYTIKSVKGTISNSDAADHLANVLVLLGTSAKITESINVPAGSSVDFEFTSSPFTKSDATPEELMIEVGAADNTNALLLNPNSEDNNSSIDIEYTHMDSDVYALLEDASGDHIKLFPNGDWEYTDGTPGGDDWSIPIDHDCINPSNDVYREYYKYRDGNAYMYQANTALLGGSGKYLSYSILKEEDGARLSTTNGDPMSDKTMLIETTFKTNEVYRLGVVFFDKKGRQSYVNWVGDILFPYFDSWLPSLKAPVLSEDTKTVDTITVDWTDPNSASGSSGTNPIDGFVKMSSGAFYSVKSYLQVTFDIARIQADYGLEIVGARVVMVERTEANMGIYAQGFINSLVYDDASKTLRPKVVPTSFNTEDLYWSALFYSPDVSIGGINYLPTDSRFIHFTLFDGIQGTYLEDGHNRMWKVITDSVSYAPEGIGGTSITDSFSFRVLEEQDAAGTPLEFTWADAMNSPKSTVSATFENRPDKDRAGVESQENYGGSGILFSIDDSPGSSPLTYDIPFDDTAIDYFYMPVSLYDIVLDKHTSRYGGISYEDRLLNTYIPCSPYISFEGQTGYVDVNAYGDTFISYYEQMLSMYDKDSDEPSQGSTGRQSIIMLPVESKVNYNFASVRPSYYMNNKAYGPPNMGIMEEQAEGIARWPDKYPDKLTDLYNYNPVYSIPAYGLYPKFTPKPLKFEDEQDNPVMVIVSEKKTNGEYVDNWTRFKYANLLEVDSKYGPITSIEAIDNRLYYWQDKAFGVIAVNERSLIQDNSGGQLTLGTGGVLERYDYLSTEVGCDFKFAVTKSENALFWYAANKNRIYMYTNQLVDVSLQAGITKYLNDQLTTIANVFSMTDFITNETLFKIGSEVLVLDWITNSFTSIYTYDPDWFIRFYDGNYLTTKDKSIYIHNSDSYPRATYYGDTYDSYIHMIVNKEYHFTKVFDTIRLDTVSKDEVGIDQYEDTFYELRVYNDYQNSDWVELHLENDPGGAYRKNMSRKERSFTTPIPRDLVNATQDSNVDIFDPNNLDAGQKYKRRIRDKYISLELNYDNGSDNLFSLPYVIVNYRNSVR